MAKVLSYTRHPFSRGVDLEEHLAYWRRITIPYNRLVDQHIFQNFEERLLEPHEELTSSMLLLPGVMILQNWVPRSETERVAFFAAARNRSPGQVQWIYDLENPALLQDERVRSILPLFHLVTVPNQRLQEEVRLFTRAFQPRVITLPSLALSQNNSMSHVLPKRMAGPPWIVGCFGDQDWGRFLPDFLPALVSLVESQAFSLYLVTDTLSVHEAAHAWGLSCFISHPLVLSYCEWLREMHMAICPREGRDARDTVWLQDYCGAHINILASRGSSYEESVVAPAVTFLDYAKPATWAIQLATWAEEYYKDPLSTRREQGFSLAMRTRPGIQTMLYAKRLREYLPPSLVGL